MLSSIYTTLLLAPPDPMIFQTGRFAVFRSFSQHFGSASKIGRAFFCSLFLKYLSYTN